MNTTTSTATEHADRPHATRSASQLGSLALCAGYRPKPTKKLHWVTAQGNRGHAALDSGDDSDLESGFEEKMVRVASEYSASLPMASRQFEELRLKTVEGRWGYTDRLRIRAKLGADGVSYEDSDAADLLDWKFVKAKHVVDAEINLQGKDYVLGIFDDEQFTFLNTIHVHFVEARFGSVTTATFTRADISRLQLEIYAVLMRARDTDRTDFDGTSLTPHYDTCKYCGAAGNCVALRRIADSLGRAYDPDKYGKTPVIPQETHASRVTEPDQRAQLQELSGLMEEWSKSVRHHNLSAALESEENLPTGYEIDWAKGRRFVKSTELLMQVAKEFGVEPADIIAASNISWGRVEQLLKDRAARGTKTKVVEAFGQRLTEMDAADRPEPTPKLRRVHTE